jgi:hypothetical protein
MIVSCLKPRVVYKTAVLKLGLLTADQEHIQCKFLKVVWKVFKEILRFVA